jgi:lysophospholipase L1-like esterase
VPGDTTAGALKRLEQDVLSRSPDLVLITLGGNDLKNGIAKDVAFKNLKMIIFTITKPF